MTSSNNSSTPDTPGTPEARAVERRVTTLLTKYAEDMPATTGTETRLREQLAAPDGTRPARPTRARWLPMPRPGAPRGVGGWARGLVSLGLVAALIAGFLGVVWLRNGAFLGSGNHGSSSGQCVRVVGTDNRAKPCPLINIKASVAVTKSYADPIRTAVELRVSVPGARIPRDQTSSLARPDTLQILGATLRDTHGRSYPVAVPLLPGHNGVAGAFGYAAGQDVAIGYYEFEPLSEADFGAPQTLTLRISGLRLIAEQRYIMELTGPWVVTFQVTPQAGRSLNLQVAPQTRHGVTLQPLRLDIAPANANAFDGLGRGERLKLRISGLASTTKVGDITYYLALQSSIDELRLDGRLPIEIQNVDKPGADPLVGSSGTLDLEIIFLALPPAQVTGAQTLSLNQLVVSTEPGTGVVTKTVKGPWVFQIPLG
jgi:hypothetical protein